MMRTRVSPFARSSRLSLFIYLQFRYPSTVICVYHPFLVIVIYRFASPFSTSQGIAPPYLGRHSFGLDPSVDFCRGTTSMANLGREMGKRRWNARTGDCTGGMQGTT